MSKRTGESQVSAIGRSRKITPPSAKLKPERHLNLAVGAGVLPAFGQSGLSFGRLSTVTDTMPLASNRSQHFGDAMAALTFLKYSTSMIPTW